jgi:NodT family efflux transporter outer membrane factor (OMF) lipoprotein
LNGCAVGPNYLPPKVHAPARFIATTEPAAIEPASTQPVAAPMPVDLMRWWESFQDPALNRLIARGIDSSLDIWLAEARVREARALLRENTAALFPTLDSSASYVRSRTSQNAFAIGGAGAGGSTSSGSTTGTGTGTGSSSSTGSGSSNSILSAFNVGTTNLYQAGFDAGWELDVFGGTRRAIEASRASLEAQVAARRNATITLISEVARNYVILRGVQHERAAVRDNVAAQRDTLDLTRSKFQAGIATDLDVARQEAQVASTESQLPTLETEIQQAIHRLAVLLDREPEALEAELNPQVPLPFGPPRVPPGLPSDLLRRRPDVQQAERQLAAASANIGVAVAELYPKFSLTGSLGLESLELKTFTRGSSAFWSFGPTASWRIFDFGQLWANVDVQRARYVEAYIQYRQAILQALQDVEDALVAYNQEQARRDALQRSVDANIRAVNLAKQLNAAGVVDFLNVLQAQQSLFVAQDQLAQSQQTVSTNLVALYKALGGGWDVNEPKPTPQQTATTTTPP